MFEKVVWIIDHASYGLGFFFGLDLAGQFYSLTSSSRDCITDLDAYPLERTAQGYNVIGVISWRSTECLKIIRKSARFLGVFLLIETLRSRFK